MITIQDERCTFINLQSVIIHPLCRCLFFVGVVFALSDAGK